MANAEHLAILEKGVEAWNEWRRKYPTVEPDLSRASLSRANLSDADLSHANLSGANLSGANLPGAILSRANLSDASLSRANLSDAILPRAMLLRAHLSGAILSGANLPAAILSRAILSGANLSGANLSIAILSGAFLSDADLRFSRLIRCGLEGATLTGAKMYGTARDDWIIKGVECRYVHWDLEGEIRSPKDRNLVPGEFEQLYQTLPTIEYVFQNGMTPLDPLIMDRVVQATREQNPEFDIKIDSISARGLAPSIKFTVQQEEQKEPALQMVIAGYESRLQQLEGEKGRLYDLLGRAIDKAGTRLIEAGPGAIVAMDNASINIDQHVEYITNLRDAVAALPENSPTFAKVAKNTALDLIGGLLKKAAEGQMKEAAKQLYELGKEFGPVVLSSAAYAAFKSMMPGG